MANGYGAGLVGGPGSRVKRKRNLEKVSTFAQMSNGQQGAGSPPGTSEVAEVADQPLEAPTGRSYSEATVSSSMPRVAGAAGGFGGPGLGAPVGGFGSGRSPLFGADTPLPPEPGQEMQPFQPEAGFADGAIQEPLDVEEPEPEYDPTGFGLPGGPSYAGADQPASLAGLTAGERAGVVSDTPQTAGIAGEAGAEYQEVDEEFEGLLDDLGTGEEAARNQLDAAFAQASRRNAEVNAAMGTSVSGGFAGARAQTTLDYLQQMQDMYADFQTRRTDLQIQWLDKKRSMDFEREMKERDEASRLIGDLIQMGQEVPEELWSRAYGEAGELKKEEMTGGGAAGEVPEGTTGEPGLLKNEAGDLLAGPGGLGTSGTVQEDPLFGEGESHQWYRRGTQGVYEYYRLDENGNEVLFEAEPGGPRFPGDSNLTARTMAETGGELGFQVGNHPEHGNDGVVQAAGSDYVGYRAAEVVPFLDWLDNRYGSDNRSNQELTMEMALFVSYYKGQNEGELPTWEEMEEHAERNGLVRKEISTPVEDTAVKDRDQYGEEETAYAQYRNYKANMRDKYGDDWEETHG